jgi:hypothetical protein
VIPTIARSVRHGGEPPAVIGARISGLTAGPVSGPPPVGTPAQR